MKRNRNIRGLQRHLCFLLEDAKRGFFRDNGFIVVLGSGHAFSSLETARVVS